MNREWAPTGDYTAPSMERSPEVFNALREIDRVGCDFFCDVHGDEELPHVFFAGSQGSTRWNNRLAGLLKTAALAYQAANPDFGDVRYNYGQDSCGREEGFFREPQVHYKTA